MKRIPLALAAAIFALGTLAAAGAHARGNPTTDKQTPAVATPSSSNPTAPVAGSNSFTQSQAMDRIMRAGYTSVRNLKKGSDGIWRGTAMMNGTTHKVMLDYQGNVTSE